MSKKELKSPNWTQLPKMSKSLNYSCKILKGYKMDSKYKLEILYWWEILRWSNNTVNGTCHIIVELSWNINDINHHNHLKTYWNSFLILKIFFFECKKNQFNEANHHLLENNINFKDRTLNKK